MSFESKGQYIQRKTTSNVVKILQEVLEQKSRSSESDQTGSSSSEQKMQMMETRIYIGLNDSKTKEQKFETKKYLGILKYVCKNYHIPFSVDIEEGGYFHEDGEYTEETTLVLILINLDRDIVKEIAKDLCTFFHQESVLITEDHLEGYFLMGERE